MPAAFRCLPNHSVKRSGLQGRWAASDPQHLIGSIKANQRSADDYERLAALADELATEEEERTGNGTAA